MKLVKIHAHVIWLMLIDKAPLDLVVQIATPENICFEYRLAGPLRRFHAMTLDFIVRLAIILLLVFVGIIISILAGISGLGIGAGAFMTAGLFVAYFFFTWFYGLFFEAMMNGQTPGKRLAGLRVISVDGRPINAIQATIRNFLRVADLAPLVSLEILSPEMPPAYMIPTFFFAFVSMILTKRMQRIGDLAAGTMVVLDDRTWHPKKVVFEDPRVPSLAAHIPISFQMTRTMAQTIAHYVDRRLMLSPARRAELASTLAQPLLRIFGFREDTSPDLTLCALYYRDFMAINESFDLQDALPLARAVPDSSPPNLSAPATDIDTLAAPSNTPILEAIEAQPVEPSVIQLSQEKAPQNENG